MEFDSELIEVRPLGSGVWSVLPRRGSGCTSNSGIVDTGQVTVVFDALQTPQAAKDLRSAARLLTGRDPTHVINSHWHFDHTVGNRVLASGTIISTARTRDQLTDRADGWERAITDFHWSSPVLALTERAGRMSDSPERDEIVEEAAFRRAVAEQQGLALLRPPLETYHDRFRLPGERVAVLIEGAGHSESDTALWYPSAGVLFSGDLVVSESHPNLASADLGRWRLALDRISEAGARHIVPGHGPVTDPSACDRLRGYFDTIEQLAAEGSTASTPPAPYSGWAYPSLFASNLAAVRTAAGR